MDIAGEFRHGAVSIKLGYFSGSVLYCCYLLRDKNEIQMHLLGKDIIYVCSCLSHSCDHLFSFSRLLYMDVRLYYLNFSYLIINLFC